MTLSDTSEATESIRGVWASGLLQREHGEPRDEITWLVAIDTPPRAEVRERLKVELGPAGESRESLVTQGELEVMIEASNLAATTAGDSRIYRPLPKDFRQFDQTTIQGLKFFPSCPLEYRGRSLHHAFPIFFARSISPPWKLRPLGQSTWKGRYDKFSRRKSASGGFLSPMSSAKRFSETACRIRGFTRSRRTEKWLRPSWIIIIRKGSLYLSSLTRCR